MSSPEYWNKKLSKLEDLVMFFSYLLTFSFVAFIVGYREESYFLIYTAFCSTVYSADSWWSRIKEYNALKRWCEH